MIVLHEEEPEALLLIECSKSFLTLFQYHTVPICML